MLKSTTRPDGTIELRRPPYAPGIYTVPQDVLDTLRHLRMSYRDARASHDGFLASWRELERFERGGKQWVLLQEPGYEYGAELELTPDGDVGEVIPLPSEKAYALAKAHDPPSVIQE